MLLLLLFLSFPPVRRNERVCVDFVRRRERVMYVHHAMRHAIFMCCCLQALHAYYGTVGNTLTRAHARIVVRLRRNFSFFLVAPTLFCCVNEGFRTNIPYTIHIDAALYRFEHRKQSIKHFQHELKLKKIYEQCSILCPVRRSVLLRTVLLPRRKYTSGVLVHSYIHWDTVAYSFSTNSVYVAMSKQKDRSSSIFLVFYQKASLNEDYDTSLRKAKW